MDALSPKQQRLLIALLSEPSIKSACRVARVGRTTAWRWLRECEEFRAEYSRSLGEAGELAKLRARHGVAVGIEVLIEVASDEDTAPSVRVSAAGKLCDLVMGAGGGEDLSERLERLERLGSDLLASGAVIGERHW